MKKLNKFLMMLVCMIFALSCSSVFAGSQRMKSIDYQVYIKENGDVDVVESWHIYVEGTNTLFKTFDIDSSKYTEITNVKVKEISDNGQAKDFRNVGEWQYTVEKDGYYGEIYEGKFEIGWYAGLGNSSDTRKYEVSYTIKDGIKKGADYAEFYWQFIGDDNAVPVEKITGTLHLPKKVKDKEDIKVWGHTEGLNGEINATALNKIEFEGWNLQTYTMFEVRTLFPTEMISENCKRYVKAYLLDDVVREETKWAEEANRRRDEANRIEENEKELRRIVGIGLLIPMSVTVVTFLKTISRNIKIYREAKDRYVPSQKLEYYREFPRECASPVEANALIKNVFDDIPVGDFGNLFAATVLGMQLKGALEIKADGEDTEFIVNDEFPTENLTKDERNLKYFLNDSVKDKYEKATVKTIKKYTKKYYMSAINLKDEFMRNARSAMRKDFIYHGSQPEESELKNGCWYICLIFSWVLVFPVALAIEFAGNRTINYIGAVALASILGFIYEKYSHKKAKKAISPLSKNGLDEQEQWRAFKRYMEDYTLLHEREVTEVALWEKYLVYATAFGTAKKVLKRIKVNLPEVYDSFTNINSPVLKITDYNFINVLNDCLVRAEKAHRAAIAATSSSSDYSSSYSSGSGGGGGFSGGGGGRRWPEAAWVVVN